MKKTKTTKVHYIDDVQPGDMLIKPPCGIKTPCSTSGNSENVTCEKCREKMAAKMLKRAEFIIEGLGKQLAFAEKLSLSRYNRVRGFERRILKDQETIAGLDRLLEAALKDQKEMKHNLKARAIAIENLSEMNDDLLDENLKLNSDYYSVKREFQDLAVSSAAAINGVKNALTMEINNGK